jgi:hypothetical protein
LVASFAARLRAARVTGGTHVTGTVAATRVSLVSSSDSGTYRLAGASWFGGNFGARGQSDFTDTEHFVILGPGGVVAHVQIVAHAVGWSCGGPAILRVRTLE